MSLKGGITHHVSGEVFWRKDGTSFPVEYISTPIQEGDKVVGTVVTFSDITERKRMEEERIKLDKLESLGVLAGGIAHDFNNMLSAILSTVSATKMDVHTGTNLYQNLIEAEKVCLQARTLSQQLLTFSRGGAPIKRLTSIEEIIRDSALFALRGSNVRSEFSIEGDLWDVEVDRGQISQVISNLVINAQQAMPQGGVVRIGARNIIKDRRRYVSIDIEDNGVGIPQEHLTRIFDPYFSTKQKGSGLGLATAHSIIKSHGGDIGVESQLGVGTKFYIYISASEAKRVEQKGAELERKQGLSSGRRRRVLIMDDEVIIRRSAGKVLMRMGYEVDYASDGQEAIEKYVRAKQSNKPFDAVIMDLTVPGAMGGKEAVEKLRSIDPEVRAVVSSGYSNDPVMSEYSKYGFRAIIPKPYSVEELSDTLNKVIGED
jgi:signal transduction histidine kinase/CheY-like chemotaxis protein